MGSMSIVHWAVVAVAALLLFGTGRISRTMGEVGQGIRALRKGLSEEDERTERLPSPTE